MFRVFFIFVFYDIPVCVRIILYYKTEKNVLNFTADVLVNGRIACTLHCIVYGIIQILFAYVNP